jgi:hypothetical protein
MGRLWGAAIVAAMIPWGYKIIMNRDTAILAAHETVVQSKLLALLLLAAYGLAYLAFTAAFGIPEARNVIDRGKRLAKLVGRSR